MPPARAGRPPRALTEQTSFIGVDVLNELEKENEEELYRASVQIRRKLELIERCATLVGASASASREEQLRLERVERRRALRDGTVSVVAVPTSIAPFATAGLIHTPEIVVPARDVAQRSLAAGREHVLRFSDAVALTDGVADWRFVVLDDAVLRQSRDYDAAVTAFGAPDAADVERACAAQIVPPPAVPSQPLLQSQVVHTNTGGVTDGVPRTTSRPIGAASLTAAALQLCLDGAGSAVDSEEHVNCHRDLPPASHPVARRGTDSVGYSPRHTASASSASGHCATRSGGVGVGSSSGGSGGVCSPREEATSLSTRGSAAAAHPQLMQLAVKPLQSAATARTGCGPSTTGRRRQVPAALESNVATVSDAGARGRLRGAGLDDVTPQSRHRLGSSSGSHVSGGDEQPSSLLRLVRPPHGVAVESQPPPPHQERGARATATAGAGSAPGRIIAAAATTQLASPPGRRNLTFAPSLIPVDAPAAAPAPPATATHLGAAGARTAQAASQRVQSSLPRAAHVMPPQRVPVVYAPPFRRLPPHTVSREEEAANRAFMAAYAAGNSGSGGAASGRVDSGQPGLREESAVPAARTSAAPVAAAAPADAATEKRVRRRPRILPADFAVVAPAKPAIAPTVHVAAPHARRPRVVAAPAAVTAVATSATAAPPTGGVHYRLMAPAPSEALLARLRLSPRWAPWFASPGGVALLPAWAAAPRQWLEYRGPRFTYAAFAPSATLPLSLRLIDERSYVHGYSVRDTVAATIAGGLAPASTAPGSSNGGWQEWAARDDNEGSTAGVDESGDGWLSWAGGAGGILTSSSAAGSDAFAASSPATASVAASPYAVIAKAAERAEATAAAAAAAAAVGAPLAALHGLSPKQLSRVARQYGDYAPPVYRSSRSHVGDSATASSLGAGLSTRLRRTGGMGALTPLSQGPAVSVVDVLPHSTLVDIHRSSPLVPASTATTNPGQAIALPVVSTNLGAPVAGKRRGGDGHAARSKRARPGAARDAPPAAPPTEAIALADGDVRVLDADAAVKPSTAHVEPGALRAPDDGARSNPRTVVRVRFSPVDAAEASFRPAVPLSPPQANLPGATARPAIAVPNMARHSRDGSINIGREVGGHTATAAVLGAPSVGTIPWADAGGASWWALPPTPAGMHRIRVAIRSAALEAADPRISLGYKEGGAIVAVVRHGRRGADSSGVESFGDTASGALGGQKSGHATNMQSAPRFYAPHSALPMGGSMGPYAPRAPLAAATTTAIGSAPSQLGSATAAAPSYAAHAYSHDGSPGVGSLSPTGWRPIGAVLRGLSNGFSGLLFGATGSQGGITAPLGMAAPLTTSLGMATHLGVPMPLSMSVALQDGRSSAPVEPKSAPPVVVGMSKVISSDHCVPEAGQPSGKQRDMTSSADGGSDQAKRKKKTPGWVWVPVETELAAGYVAGADWSAHADQSEEAPGRKRASRKVPARSGVTTLER